MEHPGTSRGSRAAVLAAVVLTIAALYFGRVVLIPLALSVVLAFLLAPLVGYIQRLGLPRVPAVLVVVFLSFGLIGGVGWLVTSQAAELAREIPRYRENIVEKARLLREKLGRVGEASRKVEEVTAAITDATTQAATAPAAAPPAGPAPVPAGKQAPEPVPVRIVGPEYGMLDLLRTALGPLLRPLGTATIVIVWVVFMLIQRESVRDRLLRLVGHARISVTTEALTEASRRVSRYLLVLVLLNSAHGLAICLGLLAIGLPSAILWGLLSALLRFIPYVGPWAAAVLPIALGLAVFDDWTRPLLVIGLFVGIELLSNNVLEPWLYGSHTGASALAILVSAVFWTWLWGPVGLVLATPLTVCLVVLGRYVPQLEFLWVILGDEPVLEPHTHYYQRLVAEDEHEADQIIESERKQRSLMDLYDQILIPALAHLERDRHRQALSPEAAQFALNAVRETLDALDDEPQPAGGGAPETRALAICAPARDEADELIARMAGHLLRRHGHRVHVLPKEMLAGELVQALPGAGADLVCISALPPATIAQVRYLCKRLRKVVPDVTLVVGLWLSTAHRQRTAERIGCGSVQLVTSLAELLRSVPRRIEPS